MVNLKLLRPRALTAPALGGHRPMSGKVATGTSFRDGAATGLDRLNERSRMPATAFSGCKLTTHHVCAVLVAPQTV